MNEKGSLIFTLPTDSQYTFEQIIHIVQENKKSAILSSSELRRIFEMYPNIYMFRGGEKDDLGEDYSFSERVAIGWAKEAHSGGKRKRPALMRIQAGDLNAAIIKYAHKKRDNNVDAAYHDIVGGAGGDYNIKIGVYDLKRAGCMPKRNCYTPINQRPSTGLLHLILRK